MRECLEFRPHDGGVNAAVERPLRKSAVGARHHAFATDEFRQPHDALRDELWVLHDVGRMAPAWYSVANIVIALPCAYVGGKWVAR